MRPSWKTRYFILTPDHLHYFEPTPASKEGAVPHEPARTAVPLGSICLHNMVGRVVPSETGLAHSFQILTTGGRVYHMCALSARCAERWIAILNCNLARIRGLSTSFSDSVFHLSVSWPNRECAVLRTGREFNTLGLLLQEHFKDTDAPAYPLDDVADPCASHKESIAKLGVVRQL